jgi:hypothetical protein
MNITNSPFFREKFIVIVGYILVSYMLKRFFKISLYTIFLFPLLLYITFYIAKLILPESRIPGSKARTKLT